MSNIDFSVGFSCNVKRVAMAGPNRLRASDRWVDAQAQEVRPNAVPVLGGLIDKTRSWPGKFAIAVGAGTASPSALADHETVRL